MAVKKRKKAVQPNLITDLRPVAQNPSPVTSFTRFTKKYSKLLLTVLVIAAVLCAAWLISTQHTNSKQKSLNHVVGRVGQLMLLPTNEQPTLATVTDKTKLTDKFLASKAANGDEVLIYTKNQMVIIYRPGINKIVAVGTVSVDPALSEAKDATLTVEDGSNNPQKTQAIIQKIRVAYPEIKLTDGGKASRQDLPETIVIDNSGNKDNLMFALIKVVSGKQGVLPLGVTNTSTDLLVIVGKDAN
ncbi:MAG TPA: hypothetical protein VFC50_03550 [Candidatus Dormibacteraeota bacterium]|nr:hypothetical protein [Candidatus Dormibacteraeota bacterium]